MSPVAVLGSRRSRIVAAGVVAVLVLAFCGFTLRLFVYPDLNAPEHSDAIVVLGGTGLEPPLEGLALAAKGYASTIAFSLVPSEHCVTSVPDQPHLRVVCFRANPQTTQGEARSIAHLAAVRHWHRVIVVMPTPQATRARLRIGRCYTGQVLEVGVSPPGFWDWLGEFAYEWGALIKALVLQPGC